MALTVLEICAGAGGQALGLETAGFKCVAAIDIDAVVCATLRLNRPSWRVIESDLRCVDGTKFRGIDLLAGGVPCPPFSIAGKQLGRNDDRDLFPEALRLIEESRPRAVLLENVPGLASPRFASYRKRLLNRLVALGYQLDWRVLNACDFGVPQLRRRFVIVGVRNRSILRFRWPQPLGKPPTVGEALLDLIAASGWTGAPAWAARAKSIAPTIVGGSKKHGGPDLGPTRARRDWAALGVNGLSIADEPPGPEYPIDGVPRLTVRMAARLQGFPDNWQFAGRKTAAYKQVGNAFPPPVARVVGISLRHILSERRRSTVQHQLRLGA